MLHLRVDKVLSVLDVSEDCEFNVPLRPLLRLMLELEIDENGVFFGTLEGRISAETAKFLACGTPVDPGG
jgi:hypothetical protein